MADSLVDEVAFRTLTADQLIVLATYGSEMVSADGDVLFSEGDAAYDLIVVLEGRADIVRRSWQGTEAPIATYGSGGFLGELSLLTGQRPNLTARTVGPGRVLRVPVESFRRLLDRETDIADLIIAAFIARRRRLEEGEGAHTLELLGSGFSPESAALLHFVRRNELPHVWTDLDDVEDPPALLASWGAHPADAPVVVTPTRVMRRPTPGELAEHLGLTYRPQPGRTFDLTVIGAGPAGLAGAVYGASEGLDVVVLDVTGVGGQAGTSSRIENYLGFPGGVSGEELTSLASVQAQRFGARIATPCGVAGIELHGSFFVVTLSDGSQVPTRAVLVATGARYRKLALDGWEDLEGRGIYYAATAIEARTCFGSEAVVVGAGNSAGQAALFLAGSGATVTMVIRGPSAVSSMSHYLLDRIESHPHIRVLTRSEVVAVVPVDGHLSEVRIRTEEEETTRPCRALFCFIGADPEADWLPADVARDRSGFVLTDRDVDMAEGDAPRLPFETSLRGVFAAGDCRFGSMKRVAAAVGEGSSSIRSVQQYLTAARHA
jgi:thioredoxin reductase (NADPH)